MFEQLKKHLENRIKELNQADSDFCKLRWDMTKTENERGIYREESNKVTFARQEHQQTLKFVLELEKKANNPACKHIPEEIIIKEGKIFGKCKLCGELY